MSGYRDSRVLVIGGLGYIGTHVTRRLLSLGAAVTVVTRSLADHRDGVLDCQSLGVRVVEGDLRDRAAMRAVASDQEVVFNLAGQSGAVRSMEDPLTDLDVNCRGSLVVLEALREVAPGAKLVFASTRLAYGHVGSAPAVEHGAAEPLCVHAVHKLAVEHYLRLYGKIYGLRFAVARLTNPYGPGQPQVRTAYGVVNRLIHLAIADDELLIYGDGFQRRDYIYVDDAVDALLRLGDSPASDGRIYNVGSGEGTRLIDMARAITRIAGAGRIRMVPWPPLAEQIETGDFVADVGRIGREIGWAPRVTLSDGLQSTVAFYRARVA